MMLGCKGLKELLSENDCSVVPVEVLSCAFINST